MTPSFHGFQGYYARFQVYMLTYASRFKTLAFNLGSIKRCAYDVLAAVRVAGHRATGRLNRRKGATSQTNKHRFKLKRLAGTSELQHFENKAQAQPTAFM